jgi:hypothetical protein
MAESPARDADLRWAAEQAPRLLAAARAEALREAQARLRGGLVDALMSAAGAASAGSAGSGESPAAARAEPAPVRVSGDDAVWVYGIMNGDVPDLPRCPGVDEDHDAELVRHAGLAAVVSAVPRDEYERTALEQSLEDLERLEMLARGHERVLDQALRLGAVVPLRLCTIYESTEHVREMLERERGSLADALQRLTSTAEWGVKAYLVPRDDKTTDDVADGPAQGTEYLARRRGERDAAEAARSSAAATVELVHHRLSEHAVDALLSRVQDRRLSGREHEMVLNAAYLVPEERNADFQSLFLSLCRRHAEDGIVLELTGPWPAYHFAGAAAAA